MRHHRRLAELVSTEESCALLRLNKHHVQLDELLSQVWLLLLLVGKRSRMLPHSLVHLHDGSDLLLDLLAIGLAWWTIVLVLVLNKVDLIESGRHRYALHHAWLLIVLLFIECEVCLRFWRLV